jgi:uncharacterized membrane protein
MTKRIKVIYWGATGLLAAGMLAQGVAQVLQTKGYVDIMSHLGFPLYFLSIIGVWKILGVIAILVPGYKLLKEWAYAGFLFVMSGAGVSHIASGDSVITIVPALILLTLIAVSWSFRPADRKITSEASIK